MAEMLLATDGPRLCVDAFGDPADPAVLLIAGGAQSMVWWEDGFCGRLASSPAGPGSVADALPPMTADLAAKPLEGMGHQQPPPQLWDLVVAALLDHTGAAGDPTAGDTPLRCTP
jgi:hypothetical protein